MKGFKMLGSVDVRMVEVDEQGDYVLEFSMECSNKRIKRWFKNEDSALAAAAFAAAQQGVVRPELLLDWLEARGFTRRQPFEAQIEEVKGEEWARK